MRIAFITPEYVTDYRDGGGLGTYLHRVGRLLVTAGHEVELFVASTLGPAIFEHDGIRVERVAPSSAKWPHTIVRKAAAWAGLAYPLALRTQAGALARALEARHRLMPFDFVQSADYLGSGMRIKSLPGRRHLVRCSSAADLYNAADGRSNRSARWRERVERKTIRRADKAYAPSQFVAEHYCRRHRMNVEVLRPPIGLELPPATALPCGLPERFLIHFGQLSSRKGTRWLLQALGQAFQMEPRLRMVLVGQGSFKSLGSWLAALGPDRAKVQVLYPLPKPELYAVLQRAEAAVLPSLVDNLPNTVIESLMLGIPVIGSRGASIDELVQDGVNGKLVTPSDVGALAEAMVQVWRGETSLRKGFAWTQAVAQEMQPDEAIANLLRFASETSPHSNTL